MTFIHMTEGSKYFLGHDCFKKCEH